MKMSLHIAKHKPQFACIKESSASEMGPADFEIIVGDTSIKTHKSILIANSQYFKMMLSHNFSESLSAKVELKDISVSTVRNLLKFFHAPGDLRLSDSEAPDTLAAASRFIVQSLTDYCHRWISMRMIQIAHDNRLANLFKSSTKNCMGQSMNVGYIYAITNRVISKQWIQSQIEFYDPARNVWTPFIGSENNKFSHATNCISYNGFLYAIGRRHNTCFIDRYDLLDGRWCGDVPQMPARYKSAVVVHDGNLYVIGGLTNEITHEATNKVHRLNLRDNVWTECAPLNSKRYEAHVAIVNGRIYIIGGMTDSLICTLSVEKYNPLLDQWGYVAPMQYRSSLHHVSFDNKLLIFGDGTAEMYDPRVDAWTGVHLGTNKAFTDYTSIEFEGLLYVFQKSPKHFFRSTYVLDPKEMKWWKRQQQLNGQNLDCLAIDFTLNQHNKKSSKDVLSK